LAGYGPRYLTCSDTGSAKIVGEFSTETNEPDGRCISIYTSGTVTLGYFSKGCCALGSYITVFSTGDFVVGERYTGADGEIHCRGIQYNMDGSKKHY
jgi:hypothetical protein